MKEGLKKQIMERMKRARINSEGHVFPLLDSEYDQLAEAAIEAIRPHDAVKELEPVLCYFPNKADRDEFIEAVIEVKPNMKAVTLEGQAE